MFNVFKLFTKSGRQSLVADYLRKYLNNDEIATIVADGFAVILGKAADKLSDEEAAKLCANLQKFADAVSATQKAINPAGDAGREISYPEMMDICELVKDGLNSILSPEAYENTIEMIARFVP